MSAKGKGYLAIAADKQRQRQEKIPKEWMIDLPRCIEAGILLQAPVNCGILDETECQITSDHDAISLLEKIKTGIWSAERVTIAFCKRAAIAHQLVRPCHLNISHTSHSLTRVFVCCMR